MHVFDQTLPISHRPSESQGRYLRRLPGARLRKDEHTQIDAIYATLDAEWAAAGFLTAPERVPWTPVDILEFRDLSDLQKYLDLKTYAHACDRIAGRTPQAQPQRLAA